MSITDIKLDAEQRRHVVRPYGDPSPGAQVAYGQVAANSLGAPCVVRFDPPFIDAPFVSYSNRGGRCAEVTIRNLNAEGFELYLGGSWTVMPPVGDAFDNVVVIDWKAEERVPGSGTGLNGTNGSN